MGLDLQKVNSKAVSTRRGHPIFDKNPSITGSLPSRIKLNKPQKLQSAYMVAPGTGEIIGQGAFTFVKEEVVDTESFVKIYFAGIKGHSELSKAGLSLFEFVYKQVSSRGGQDTDKVEISYLLALQWKPELKRATYFRGLNELIEKGFIFCSMASDVYYMNINFMFNGNRINLLKSYIREGYQEQIDLPLLPSS